MSHCAGQRYPTPAKNYYYDATAGLNTNRGNSEDAPRQTIADANALALKPGDRVLFKKAEKWREQLTVPSSGKFGRPILFASYGSGVLPVITGANLVSVWTEAIVGANITFAANFEEGDVTDWSATGTLNGGTVTATAGAARSGSWGCQCLVPAPGTTDRRAFGTITLGAAVTEYALDFYFNIADLVMADADEFVLVRYTTSPQTTAMNLHRSGSNYQVQFRYKNTTVIATDWVTISKTAWNHILIYEKAESGAAAADGISKCWVNGVALVSVTTCTATNTATWNGVDMGFRYALEDGTIGNIYVDDVTMCDTQPSLNVWQAALTTEPHEVYFDGTKGAKQVSAAVCDAPYDWYWASNVLYTYVTSDPDTAYVTPGVEADNRAMCISLGSQSNIVIDSLHCTHSTAAGIRWYDSAGIEGNGLLIMNCDVEANHVHGIYIRLAHATLGRLCGLIIANNTVHHNGNWDGADNWGFGILVEATPVFGMIAPMIRQNSIHNSYLEGIRVNGGWYGTIHSNYSYQDGDPNVAHSAGIMLGGTTKGMNILGNLIEEAGGEGVFIGQNAASQGSHIIANNLCLNCGDTGIAIARYDHNCQILHNTSVGCTGLAIIGNASQVTGTVIKNNVCDDAGFENILLANSSTITSNNNCFDESKTFEVDGVGKTWAQWQALGYDADSLRESPVFVTEFTNLHLQVTSPCIAAGDPTVGVLQDYDGVLRGAAVDIGAYEYVA